MILDELNLQKLRLVNERIKKLQNKLINEAVKLDKELQIRNLDKKDILDDYELNFRIDFILDDSNKNYKTDEDNIITTIHESAKGFSKKIDFYPYNEANHNEFKGWENHHMKDDHHCWWFHCLYDHNHLTWDEMLNIGEIWSDIEVKYQYFD